MITALGIASLLFCVLFTIHGAARASTASTGQTMRESLAEAWSNIAIGFSINYAANLLFLPMLGAELTATNNFWLGCIYTAISFLRQLVLRRLYNRRVTKRS